MKLYVIMTNDYPAAVFDDEAAAERYCDAKMKEQQARASRTGISWRCYGFELNDTASADAFHESFIKANPRTSGAW